MKDKKYHLKVLILFTLVILTFGLIKLTFAGYTEHINTINSRFIQTQEQVFEGSYSGKLSAGSSPLGTLRMIFNGTCTLVIYYFDNDLDGFGDPAVPQAWCPTGLPIQWVLNNTDCDDTVDTCHVDCITNVDGDALRDCEDLCIDADGDFFGRTGSLDITTCSGTPIQYDCVDINAAINPGVGTEANCSNNEDDDCDLTCDTTGCGAMPPDADCVPVDYYCDDDTDLYFDLNIDGTCSGTGCEPPTCQTFVGNDCVDTDANIHPANGPNCSCLPSPIAEICDNWDNDCDGTVDGFTQATTCGVGECVGNTGVETCTTGAWGADTCDPLVGATAEVCVGGLDEDCDGDTDAADSDCVVVSYYCDDDGDLVFDENVDGTCSPTGCEPPTCQTFAGADCLDTNINVHPGATEICNNLDDDCNGTTDLITQPTTCGVGACLGNTGVETCTAGSWGADTCDPLAGATPETCNNIDDDCDNIVDGFNQATTCGVGACLGNTGIETCTAGSWGADTCDPLAGATPETCNNIDDDCDNTVDGYSQATTCGVGECAGNTGTETCTAGSWGADTCDPLAGAVAEVCTGGLDEDCDGDTDGADTDCVAIDYYCDDDTDTYYDLNIDGTCFIPGCEPPGCVTAVGDDCDDTDPNIHPFNGPNCSCPPSPVAEFCDGEDNNCDGTVDEGFDYDDCQQLCLTHATGNWTGTLCCGDDALENDPYETPSELTCDDTHDNDCDGDTDGADSDCDCTLTCGVECSIADQTNNILKIRMFENYIIWLDWVQVNLMDLTTKIVTDLTGISAVPTNAPTSGSYYDLDIYVNPISNQVLVAYVNSVGGSSNLHLYDSITNNTIPITTTGDVDINVGNLNTHKISIYNNRIVWEQNSDNNLYLYDIEKGTTTQVTSSGNFASWPTLYGDVLIWSEGSNIYKRDLNLLPLNNTTLLHTVGFGTLYIIDMYGDHLYYQDGLEDVYYCNISNCPATATMLATSDDRFANAFGDHAVWASSDTGSWDIKHYEIGTGINPLESDPDVSFNPVIYGDKVVWADYRDGNYDIYYEQIISACGACIDLDGDGYGYGSCVNGSFDCNDNDGSIHPGVAPGNDICDGKDNDCDGLIDEDAVGTIDQWFDEDGDGYGDLAILLNTECRQMSGYVLNDGDCDDDTTGEAASCATIVSPLNCTPADNCAICINPGMTELCSDGIDNDCDGFVDNVGFDCLACDTNVNIAITGAQETQPAIYDDYVVYTYNLNQIMLYDANLGGATQITNILGDQPAGGTRARIYGNDIIYIGSDNNIWHYDITTQATQQITTGGISNSYRTTAIFNGRIVYRKPDSNFYLYDINTNGPEQVLTGIGGYTNTDIYADKVVVGNATDLTVKDLSTGAVTNLLSGVNSLFACMYGNNITFGSGANPIRYCSLADNCTTPFIVASAGIEQFQNIFGNYIIWEGFRGGATAYDLYYDNISSHVADGNLFYGVALNDSRADIYGDRVVFQKNSGNEDILLRRSCTLGTSPCSTSNFDLDGDGYGYGCTVKYDCNDADASINIMATELCGDQKDNNCNGLIDEGCI